MEEQTFGYTQATRLFRFFLYKFCTDLIGGISVELPKMIGLASGQRESNILVWNKQNKLAKIKFHFAR